jgi:hypothetical protein
MLNIDEGTSGPASAPTDCVMLQLDDLTLYLDREIRLSEHLVFNQQYIFDP